MIHAFEETVAYFGEKLGSVPPEEDLQAGEVELVVDNFNVRIEKGEFGSLNLSLDLGLMLQPIPEPRLKELVNSNFMGIDTGGCVLALDETGVLLSLRATTTSGTPPQENWEWLHRTLSVARTWSEELANWGEYVPLSVVKGETTDAPLFKKA